MRTTLKLVLPLAVSVLCVSTVYTIYQVRTERRNLRNDLSHRSAVLAENLQESLESSSGRANDRSLNHIVERYGQREHLGGVAVYDADGKSIAITPGLSSAFATRPAQATRAVQLDAGVGDFPVVKGAPFHIYAVPLHRNGQINGSLIVVYDTGFIDSRLDHTLRDSLLNTLVQTLLIIAFAVLLVRWTFASPLAKMAKWLRSLRAGSPGTLPALPQGEIFDQLHAEVRHLARDLTSARAAAREEAQLRETQSALWTSDRLRVSLESKLQGDALFVVSNREPYMHVFSDDGSSVRVIVPASGLVTALEPVLQACRGTWVANGSGSADRDVVDEHDRIEVPPHNPAYTLRRVWLSEEEDRGYYEGFSNEGLWPLCHIAHTRPLFGADLVGFHVQTHCNNFLQTVDRALEALTDWARFEVSRQGHITRVRPYPISVAFPQKRESGHIIRITGEGRAALFAELGVEASLLGVGVDRVDYTKGIVERFRGIERFLELHPSYQRRFTFVELGAPSRTDILRYRQFLDEVSAEAERINTRFQSGRWKPIVFLKRHHSHEEIERFFRAASLCPVTSLHDGMNLVAKEFIATRDDNKGVLILSTFTGAAHELTDALLVNPYDIDQMANAIYQALEFDESEQIARMSRMRGIVREQNVYRWAARLISDLAEIRVEKPQSSEVARAS